MIVIGPQPGDVGVPGQIVWCKELPAFRLYLGTPLFAGWVRASSEVFGFVAADIDDPLRFPFSSTIGFSSGEIVMFDVVALPYGAAATNLAPLMMLEDYVELTARHLTKAGQREDTAKLREMTAGLYSFD